LQLHKQQALPYKYSNVRHHRFDEGSGSPPVSAGSFAGKAAGEEVRQGVLLNFTDSMPPGYIEKPQVHTRVVKRGAIQKENCRIFAWKRLFENINPSYRW
jgi:hypothetical protein